LIKLEKKPIRQASLMLTRAFPEDEMKDVLPDPEERRRKIPYVNEFYLRRNFSRVLAYASSPKLEGIAVWIHSEKVSKTSFWQILSSGAIWPAVRIGVRALSKMDKCDDFLKKKHDELAPFKHLYLAVLAVDPEHQGKGHASRLVRKMLDEIDKEGLPCYVETEGEKNVEMYRHFGFEVAEEFVVPDTQDKIVAMLRHPQAV